MKSLITEKWNCYLQKFKDFQKDLYYCEEYVKLYETLDSKALCAVCYEDEYVLIMPFIRKEVDGFYDFETAYGYGGPLSNVDKQDWIETALEEMKALFKREKYVCGFIRFHPLLKNVEYCKEHIQVIFDRSTVAINTAEMEKQIWSNQITSKNRNMIRKAEKNGLVYVPEYDFASLGDFLKLYIATMKRLNAEDFYFFDENYFSSFVYSLSGRAFLGTIRKDGELICAALFMYSEDYGHYHLEGSNHTYSSLGANNLLLWKTALEFNKKGIKEFHLGGGYNSAPDNSLLKFKKSFSGNMKDFFIGKWIFNEGKYLELKDNWMKKYPEKIAKYGGLLLCYRY